MIELLKFGFDSGVGLYPSHLYFARTDLKQTIYKINRLNLKIVNSNIALLEKNVWEVSKVYESGLIEEESLQQLQLTLSGLKSNQRYSKRLKDLAYQMFNNSLGLDLTAAVVLTNSFDELVVFYSTLTTSRSENEFEEVIDFKIAVNSVKSDELLLKLEKSKALPTLANSVLLPVEARSGALSCSICLAAARTM